jgi:Cation transport ATPase
MVEYIVTDKTGTLTENKLKVAHCIINQKIYIESSDILNSDSSQRYDQNSKLNSNERNN